MMHRAPIQSLLGSLTGLALALAGASQVACSSGATGEASGIDVASDGGATGNDATMSEADGGAPVCGGVSCSAPPTKACLDGSTLRTYAAKGTCASDNCTYAHTDAKCAAGCQNDSCVGADPCDGVVCNSPPAAMCADPKTLTSYSPSGTCAGGTCSYQPAGTATTCACRVGACVSFGAATTLSAGGNKHACVSTASGVKCWGRNDAGELGTGAKSGFSNVPLDATAFTSASLVSVGDQHTCVLTGAGGVECVGFNGFGGLGNGTKVDSLMAVKVVGLSAGAISVSAGDAFTCAVNSTGGAQCWGRGINGQLGNGSFADSSSPVDVQGLTSGVASVSAHFAFACALTTAGSAKCWGDGTFGKLGRGAGAPGATPADVVGLTSGVVSISTGNQHACAVTSTGGVKCWGYNGHGQLGNGAMPTNANAPVDVVGLTSGVVSVSAGEEHSCAVTTTGTVKCWGSNAKGQLGNGAIGGVSDVPVSVSGLTGVSKVVMGYYHSCALTAAGAVKCWGSNSYGGELGNNDTKDSAVPVSVLGLP